MTGDQVDEISAALARLRGPRRPRPGEVEHDHPHHGPPWAHGAHGGHGGPPWARGAGHGRIGGPARMRMLEALAAASAPLSVSELGDAIGVDQPRASRLVQQGVDHGTVRREADPADARRTRIALTDEGRALVQGFRGERREMVTAALEGFTDDERATLARLLTKLSQAWPR